MGDVRLTRAAAQDINDIEHRSAVEFGSAQTVEYLSGLHEAFARLGQYPGIGIVRHDLRPDTRSLSYRSHRIYYRPMPGGILIQRVLHYARQVRREMFE